MWSHVGDDVWLPRSPVASPWLHSTEQNGPLCRPPSALASLAGMSPTSWLLMPTVSFWQSPCFSGCSRPPTQGCLRGVHGTRRPAPLISCIWSFGPHALCKHTSVGSTQKIQTYLKFHANPLEKLLLLWLKQTILVNVYNFDSFLKPKPEALAF